MGKCVVRSEGRSSRNRNKINCPTNSSPGIASKHKIEEACKALKPLGISKAKVKAKLNELLELYDNKCELIEDEGYQVLLNATLEKSDESQVYLIALCCI
ncbi:hypothetical protein JCGZ_02385 [Jatropha curcas]|uniref:WIYLD domain-containing protein n=1 Tax=Jatropha curcas TaxID=180498 RepID=A0A067KW62_JATCU|nr:hypothetical protein JCGZ_02385 [Jatropha curcas]